MSLNRSVVGCGLISTVENLRRVIELPDGVSVSIGRKNVPCDDVNIPEKQLILRADYRRQHVTAFQVGSMSSVVDQRILKPFTEREVADGAEVQLLPMEKVLKVRFVYGSEYNREESASSQTGGLSATATSSSTVSAATVPAITASPIRSSPASTTGLPELGQSGHSPSTSSQEASTELLSTARSGRQNPAASTIDTRTAHAGALPPSHKYKVDLWVDGVGCQYCSKMFENVELLDDHQNEPGSVCASAVSSRRLYNRTSRTHWGMTHGQVYSTPPSSSPTIVKPLASASGKVHQHGSAPKPRGAEAATTGDGQMKRMTSPAGPLGDPRRSWVCARCGRKFVSEKLLQKHRASHSD